MNNLDKKCQECGGLLKSSQFARIKREGASAEKAHNNLVCRNYPRCAKAEKEGQVKK